MLHWRFRVHSWLVNDPGFLLCTKEPLRWQETVRDKSAQVVDRNGSLPKRWIRVTAPVWSWGRQFCITLLICVKQQ
jgi:hypothetical protein